MCFNPARNKALLSMTTIDTRRHPSLERDDLAGPLRGEPWPAPSTCCLPLVVEWDPKRLKEVWSCDIGSESCWEIVITCWLPLACSSVSNGAPVADFVAIFARDNSAISYVNRRGNSSDNVNT